MGKITGKMAVILLNVNGHIITTKQPNNLISRNVFTLAHMLQQSVRVHCPWALLVPLFTTLTKWSYTPNWSAANTKDELFRANSSRTEIAHSLFLGVPSPMSLTSISTKDSCPMELRPSGCDKRSCRVLSSLHGALPQNFDDSRNGSFFGYQSLVSFINW